MGIWKLCRKPITFNRMESTFREKYGELDAANFIWANQNVEAARINNCINKLIQGKKSFFVNSLSF